MSFIRLGRSQSFALAEMMGVVASVAESLGTGSAPVRLGSQTRSMVARPGRAVTNVKSMLEGLQGYCPVCDRNEKVGRRKPELSRRTRWEGLLFSRRKAKANVSNRSGQVHAGTWG